METGHFTFTKKTHTLSAASMTGISQIRVVIYLDSQQQIAITVRSYLLEIIVIDIHITLFCNPA